MEDSTWVEKLDLKFHLVNDLLQVFFSSENKSTIEIWDEIWSDSTSSYEGSFRMHGTAIISLLSDMLQSSSWTMKAQVNCFC